jgi:hypothetical protein
MSSVSVLRTHRTITTLVLDFPDLRQKMPVAIDNDTKDVYITPWFYPGGPQMCARACVEQGEPMLSVDKGYLVRASFVTGARHFDPKKSRAVAMLIQAATRALEMDATAMETDDPNGFVLYGADKGRMLDIDGTPLKKH